MPNEEFSFGNNNAQIERMISHDHAAGILSNFNKFAFNRYMSNDLGFDCDDFDLPSDMLPKTLLLINIRTFTKGDDWLVSIP